MYFFFLVIFFIPLLIPFQKPSILDETGINLQFLRFISMIIGQSLSIGLFIFLTLLMIYIGITGDGEEYFPLIGLVSQFLCGLLIFAICTLELMSCEKYIVLAINKTNEALLSQSKKSGEISPIKESEIISSRTERNILKRSSKEYSFFCILGIINGLLIILTSFILFLSTHWLTYFLYSLFARIFEIYLIFISINTFVLKVMRDQLLPPSEASITISGPPSPIATQEMEENSKSISKFEFPPQLLKLDGISESETLNNANESWQEIQTPNSLYSNSPLKIKKSNFSPTSNKSYQILNSYDLSPSTISTTNKNGDSTIQLSNIPTYIVKDKGNNNSTQKKRPDLKGAPDIKVYKNIRKANVNNIYSAENSPLFQNEIVLNSLPPLRTNEVDLSPVASSYPTNNQRIVSDRFPEQDEWLQQQPNWIKKWEK